MRYAIQAPKVMPFVVASNMKRLKGDAMGDGMLDVGGGWTTEILAGGVRIPNSESRIRGRGACSGQC